MRSTKLIELARDAIEDQTAGGSLASDPQRASQRGSDAIGRSRGATDRRVFQPEPFGSVHGIARAEFRSVSGARVTLELEGDANDYVGKGFRAGG